MRPILASLLALPIILACGSDPSASTDGGAQGPPCTPGVGLGCTCPDTQALGNIVCGPDGRWGACTSCPPPSDAGSASCRWYYVDADGDGFGTGDLVEVCGSDGNGYSTTSGDCNDQDRRVFPGQPLAQEGNADFNCDGTIGVLEPAVARCDTGEGPGWVGAVPACGAPGTWTDCAHLDGGLVSEPRTQKCL